MLKCCHLEATAEAKLVMHTVKRGIETANEALNLFEKLVEQVLPVKEFSESLNELDKFQNEYSTESAVLISEIKAHIFDGMNGYLLASQMIYEWTGIATMHLNLYASLFNGYDARRAEAQKQLLIRMLDSGVVKMNEAQDQLGNSSMCFNSAAGRLTVLRKRFEFEFDEKSDYFQKKIQKIRIKSSIAGVALGWMGMIFVPKWSKKKFINKLMDKLNELKKFYDNLNDKVQDAMRNIVTAKVILKKEVNYISDLKVQTQQTITFVQLDDVPDLRDTVIESIRNLTTKCEEYRNKLIDKIPSI